MNGGKLPDGGIQDQREDQGDEFQRCQPCRAINSEGNSERESRAPGEEPIGDQRQPIIGIGPNPFGDGEG